MSTGPTNVVLILGDVGEVGEEAEGANDLKSLIRRQAIQRRFKLATRHDILVSPEADRVLSDLLDGIEDCLAALLAYRVPEDAAEQPNIFAQWNIFVVLSFNSHWDRHGPSFRFVP